MASFSVDNEKAFEQFEAALAEILKDLGLSGEWEAYTQLHSKSNLGTILTISTRHDKKKRAMLALLGIAQDLTDAVGPAESMPIAGYLEIVRLIGESISTLKKPMAVGVFEMEGKDGNPLFLQAAFAGKDPKSLDALIRMVEGALEQLRASVPQI